MPRAPYENVSARPAQLNSVVCPKGNGFTYGSNNHAIQWMLEQPNRLKGVKRETCFLEEKNTCAGTVEKWQKEKAYMSQMQVTNPGKETYCIKGEIKNSWKGMTNLRNQRAKEEIF